MFDMKVHTDQGMRPSPAVSTTIINTYLRIAVEEDYTALYNKLRESISLVKNDKEFTPGQAAFGHLMGGYDAGYYGYMYSLVFAADMYATVFKADPLDPKRGKPLVVHFVSLGFFCGFPCLPSCLDIGVKR
jgi:Zn-dependent oligopeptidase